MYAGIFWLSAATEATLSSGIYELARVLRLVDDSVADFETACNSLLRELTVQDYWLMVLDDVDDVDLVRRFLPFQHGTRHVLITSSIGDAYVTLDGSSMHLDVLSEDEARMLFSNAYYPTQLDKLDMPDGIYEDLVMRLIQQLGYLPLAIIQAASYLSETQDNISSYLQKVVGKPPKSCGTGNRKEVKTIRQLPPYCLSPLGRLNGKRAFACCVFFHF